VIVSSFEPRAAKALAPGEVLSFRAYPGLRLVVTATRKTWTYRYAQPDTGKQKQLALGLWPAVGFGEAVAAWEKARGVRSKGVDVGDEKRAEVRATKARVLAAKNRERQTCAFVVERYLEETVEMNRKAKGAAEARRMLERAIVPIAAVPARELTKAQARDVIVRVAATARRVAAMTRQELRACWSYASDQGWVDEGVNPFGGKDLGGRFKASARDRALAGTEAGALLRWMHEPGAYSRTVADALELVLRTGLRSGEVCSIRSTELVERAGVLWLEIPAARMKGKKAHSAPLVGRARTIVEARMTDLPGFLFARRQREGDEPRPIEQKVLGVEVYAHAGRSKAAAFARKRVCPVRDWAPHDLRRTARTLLGDLGCPFEVGEAILAHLLPGVAGVYNRAAYEAQKIEWLVKLGDHLDTLAASRNVVSMNQRVA
jgi:integrase